LPNGTTKQILAGVVNQPDFDPTTTAVSAAPFNLEFEAAFPFLLGRTLKSQSFGLATIGGGTVPSPTMPSSLSANTPGNLFAVNTGTAPAYPTARIAGPVTNPTLRSAATGMELRLTLTLAAGEYVDLDFRRNTITDIYGTNRYGSKNGDWWLLNAGTSEIRFLADSYDASAQATLLWYDTYLSL
jgi:hypothetical protein